MWPYFPLSITNKPREWCQGAREGDGGGAGLGEKAEHKHNSNRNQLEPSKLFIRQMDTFPRDFTVKHGDRAPRARGSLLSKASTQNGDNITLSKPFHVWFISSLKSGSPSTPWSHVCSPPQAQGRRNMFSILYLQRRRHRYDLVWRILYKSKGPRRRMSYTVDHRWAPVCKPEKLQLDKYLFFLNFFWSLTSKASTEHTNEPWRSQLNPFILHGFCRKTGRESIKRHLLAFAIKVYAW